MHDIYCLQLERFLCRDCGKVKCSCDAPEADNQHTTKDVSKNAECEPISNDVANDSIEYRRPRLSRQHSGPENIVPQKPPPYLSHKAAEQQFNRCSQGENGKLRRSFAVRSREGLENLLGLASIRKGQEQGKTKQTLRQ